MLEFPKRVLFLGYGAVAQCALPIFVKHVRIPPANITVMDFEDRGDALKPWIAQGVNWVRQQITAENGGEEPFQAKLVARNETYEDAWRKQRREMIVAAMHQHVSDGVPEVAEQVHARHILVSTQEEAERLLAQLQAGADFATLASAYSQDPNTRDSGGDLGFFPRGLLTAPEVEEAAFSLQPGQFSGVVPSLLGYHMVQVVERDPARPVNPDDRRLLQEQALQEWVEGLWAPAVIQIFVEMAP